MIDKLDLLDKALKRLENSKKKEVQGQIEKPVKSKKPREVRPEKKIIIDEHILKLVKIGQDHDLTLENMLRYIKTHGQKTKLYKLADYFSEANLNDIEAMLNQLFNSNQLKKNKNGWISLK